MMNKWLLLPTLSTQVTANKPLMFLLGATWMALGAYLSFVFSEVFYGVIFSLFASYVMTLLVNTRTTTFYILGFHCVLLLIAFSQADTGLGVAKVFTGITFSLFTIYLLHMTMATIRNSVRQTQNIAKQERIRIMRDLHDSMGHQLQSAIFLLKHPPIKQQQINNYLNNAKRHLELSIDAVDIKGRDLYSLLEKLVTSTQTSFSSIEINLDNQLTDLSLLDNIEYEPLRELQFMIFELLSNALQHAKANQISVKIWADNKHAHVQVRDNGIGFDTATTQQRGLMFLHKRAARVSIEVNMSSQPGQTDITLSLPLA